MLTLSGTPDFTPFGEFMISSIHYRTLYITEFVSFRTMCLRINDSDLFAWISLTALSWTSFIVADVVSRLLDVVHMLHTDGNGHITS